MSALHLAGYDASTAAEWAKNVHVWGKLLEGHPDARACIDGTGDEHNAQGGDESAAKR
jgi:hypothetical protein